MSKRNRKKTRYVEWSVDISFPGIRIDGSMGPEGIRQGLRDFMEALKS